MSYTNQSHGTGDVKFDSVELYIEAVLLMFICVGAIIGNISMWFIICRSRELRTVTNAFILGLTTADLLVSFLNMPVTIATLLAGNWPLSSTMCVFFGFTNMLTLVTSVLSLCNISINRFVMVCKPIYYKKIYTRRKAGLMMAGCVTLSVCLSFPPFFGWAEYGFIPIQSFCFCKWEESLSYAFFMIICCFGGPFTVMSICNFRIFRTVRASKRRVENNAGTALPKTNSSDATVVETDHTSYSTSDKVVLTRKLTHSVIPEETSHDAVTVTIPRESTIKNDQVFKISRNSIEKNPEKSRKKSKNSQQGKKRAEEVRLATALAVVVLVFVICWFPYCISMMLSIFAPNKVPRGFHMATLLIGYSNSGINPVIYGVMNKKFGDGFRRIFCCLCRDASSSTSV